MLIVELREFLSTRLPNEHIRGLKKKELQELYDKEISSSPPVSDTDTEPLESPKNIQEVVPESQEPEPKMEHVTSPDPVPNAATDAVAGKYVPDTILVTNIDSPPA